MMLDLTRITGVTMGKCQDIWCESNEEPEPVFLTWLRYIDSNKTGAWVCEGCLEGWSDALEEYIANMIDLDLPDAYPMIP